MQPSGTSLNIPISGREWGVDNKPVFVRACPVCHDNLADKVVCEASHTVCSVCLPQVMTKTRECSDCRSKVPNLETRSLLEKGVKRELDNLTFLCQVPGCGWKGDYSSIPKHLTQCVETPRPCQFSCGISILPAQIEDHKTVCRKRPVHEGGLKTDFQTLQEIKKLKQTCQVLSTAPEEKEEHRRTETFDQLVRLFPVVTGAALQPVQAEQAGFLDKEAKCEYQCGYKTLNAEELGQHLQNCALVPVTCRYCSDLILRKDSVEHGKLCDRRPVTCKHCKANMLQKSLASHLETCPELGLICNFCSLPIPRKDLQKHTDQLCRERPYQCHRCLNSLPLSGYNNHQLECRFMQNIILPAAGGEPALTLVPQASAVGPFYQEGKNDKTIYFATTSEILKTMLKRLKAVYPGDVRCNFDGSNARLIISQCCSYEHWLVLRLVQYGHGHGRTRDLSKCVRTYFDLLDAKGEVIRKLYRGGSKYVSVIDVNYEGDSGAAELWEKDKIRGGGKSILDYQSDSDLRLFRIRKES